jgi:excisionase family DNA binding protein
MIPQEFGETLSVREAAWFLHMKTATIYELTRKKQIPFCKPGGHKILFIKKDLLDWLESKRVPVSDASEQEAKPAELIVKEADYEMAKRIQEALGESPMSEEELDEATCWLLERVPTSPEAPAVEVPEQYQTRLANSFVNILLFVVDPSTGEHVPAEEWRKREDKTTAEWVGIRNENGILFCIRKKELNEGKDLKWDEAHKMMDTDAGENLGRRKWWCDVYDAIYTAGLNDLLVEIGGDRIRDKFYWTEDKDVDPSSSAYAWLFYGYVGGLNYYDSRCNANGARVFRAF